jgi:serine/threonine-protein kinase HipA
MSAKERKLSVFAHLGADWAPCGQLILTEEGPDLSASSFAYGTRYLTRKDALEVDPISLGLSNKEQMAGKRLLPANGLPFFGGIRDATPDAWGRRVIEAKHKVPANSLSESEYLLQAGSERVGALDVRSSLTAGPLGGVGSWHSLAHLMEAADRIEEGLPIPAHLEGIFGEGSALGGARPKASVRDDEGVLWLAKFSSRHDAFDMPGIEAAALKMAALAGLNVPPVDTQVIGKRRVMTIRRFDRYWAKPGEKLSENWLDANPAGKRQEHRMGFVSGLTLVGCDETESRTKSYADLADAVRKYCHPDVIAQDNAELFKRMVYNILVSNDDDHLRNHAFIKDPLLSAWRLSPLYDVLPRPSLAKERFLHLGVGPEGRLASLDNALAAHARFTVSREVALGLIDEVWRVVRQWRMHFGSFGVPENEMDKVAAAFRHIDEVASPTLRKAMP